MAAIMAIANSSHPLAGLALPLAEDLLPLPRLPVQDNSAMHLG